MWSAFHFDDDRDGDGDGMRRTIGGVVVVMMAVGTSGAYLAPVHSIWGFPCASPLLSVAVSHPPGWAGKAEWDTSRCLARATADEPGTSALICRPETLSRPLSS